MLGKVCVPLAALAVFLGTASAGEESLMAMRGNAPDGRTGLNQFRPEGGRTDEKNYVGWRDNCVQVPRLVAGQALVVDCPDGFGYAQPLGGPPESGESPSLDLFIKELTRG